MSGSFLCYVGTYHPSHFSPLTWGILRVSTLIALHLLFYSISTYLLRTYYVPGASWVLRIQTSFLLSWAFILILRDRQ